MRENCWVGFVNGPRLLPQLDGRSHSMTLDYIIGRAVAWGPHAWRLVGYPNDVIEVFHIAGCGRCVLQVNYFVFSASSLGQLNPRTVFRAVGTASDASARNFPLFFANECWQPDAINLHYQTTAKKAVPRRWRQNLYIFVLTKEKKTASAPLYICPNEVPCQRRQPIQRWQRGNLLPVYSRSVKKRDQKVYRASSQIWGRRCKVFVL